VAALADVGITWYTFLEQGRPIKMSADALRRVGDALRLAPQEVHHLFLLADRTPPCPSTGEEVPDSVAALVASLDESPVWVVNPLYDIVAWNRAAASVACVDLDTVSQPDRNLLWLMLTDPEPRLRQVDWEHDAQSMIAALRASRGENKSDRRFTELIDRLLDASPEFREWWPRQDVIYPRSMAIEMNHPEVGALRFGTAILRPEAAPGLRLLVWTPEALTPTRVRLGRLLKHSADLQVNGSRPDSRSKEQLPASAEV
jgi:hypothetical protein